MLLTDNQIKYQSIDYQFSDQTEHQLTDYQFDYQRSIHQFKDKIKYSLVNFWLCS